MVKKKYVERIIDACPIDYFLSANDSCRMFWPFRMQPTNEANKRYSQNSRRYAIDSAIQKPELGNEEAIEQSIKCDADIVLLKDYLPFESYWEAFDDDTPEERREVVEKLQREYGDNYTASRESIKRGLEKVENSCFEGEVWIPLQDPHIEMYYELDRPDTIAIGGIKNKSAKEKVEKAKKIRNEIGEEIYMHLLGVGVTNELIEGIDRNPHLFDSMDSQSPMASALNSSETWKGNERMSPIASVAQSNILEDCRRMSDLSDNPNKIEEGEGSLFDY